MTYNIRARSASEALYLAKAAMKTVGVERETRAGPVLEFPEPVVTTYTRPRERVIFYPERDANPFFHLMESMWMLDGRNDVPWIQEFNSRIQQYSDNGDTFHGAYGHRWRKHFIDEWHDNSIDQFKTVIHRLNTYPNDRRTVLAMWDVYNDLKDTNENKDLPCNTHIYFQKRDGILDMTVCNRSNDMIWGCYGANVVHMSFLMEYIASMTGSKMGKYTQFSNNLHAYKEQFEKIKDMGPDYDPYLCISNEERYTPLNLVDDPETFDQELKDWVEGDWSSCPRYKNSFLCYTAEPARQAWRDWKAKEMDEAIAVAKTIASRDWRKACVEWLQRRVK